MSYIPKSRKIQSRTSRSNRAVSNKSVRHEKIHNSNTITTASPSVNLQGNIIHNAGVMNFTGSNVQYLQTKTVTSFPLELPYHELQKLVKNFCGRDDELKNIHEQFKNSNLTILSQIKAITGLGGIGKTELAKAYAEKYKNEYNIILYIVAETESSLLEEFYDRAELFGIDTKSNDENKRRKPIKLIIKQLYGLCSSQKALIILDNIEEQEHVIGYIPDENHQIKILITTRKRKWDLGDFGKIETVEVGIFSSDKSKQFIVASLKPDWYTEDDICKLSERVENLPLGLNQAVKYICEENSAGGEFGMVYRICDYIIKFDKNKEEILGYSDKYSIYELTIMNTWKITVDKLDEKHGEIGKRAIKILYWLAYLKPDQISAKRIFNVDENCLNMKAINLLYDYSLIDLVNGNISIHRLVQDVTKIYVKKNKIEEEILNELVEILHKNCTNTEIKRCIGALWTNASHYPNILKRHYYNFRYNPLHMIWYEVNPDKDTIEILLNFALKNKQHKDISKSFRLSLRSENVSIVEFIYDFIKEKCPQKIDINGKFKESIHITKNRKIFDFFIKNGCRLNRFYDKLHTPIMLACKHENNNYIKYLLENRECDVTIKNSDGQDVLMIACKQRDNNEIIKTLVHFGKCDFYARDKRGQNAFMLACQFQNEKLIGSLVENNDIDWNLRDNDGKTALFYALFNEKSDTVVKILIESGKLDINSKDNEGTTIFMHACRYGRREVIDLFLNNNECLTNTQNDQGFSALMMACYYDRNETVEQLLNCQNVDVALRDNNGRTALVYSCLNNNLNIFQSLKNSGKIDLNQQDNDGYTVLMRACEMDSVQILEILLQEDDCQLNTQDNTGRTALMIACLKGRKKITELLLQNPKVDPTIRDHNEKTAFVYANKSNSWDVVRNLLESDKFDLNERDEDGCTILMRACEKGSIDIVKILLDKKGCHVNAQDPQGRTAFMKACFRGRKKTVELLMANPRMSAFLKDDHGRTAIVHACINNQHIILRILVDSGKYDLNEKYIAGYTILMRACIRGFKDIVEILAANKSCDLNIRNDNGFTAIMCALKHNNNDIVELLIRNPRINIELRNRQGYTVFLDACKRGNVKTIELLLNNCKFDINGQNKKGRTALHLVIVHCSRYSYLHFVNVQMELVQRGCNVDIRDVKDKKAFDYWEDWGVEHTILQMEDMQTLEGRERIIEKLKNKYLKDHNLTRK